MTTGHPEILIASYTTSNATQTWRKDCPNRTMVHGLNNHCTLRAETRLQQLSG